MFAVAAWQAVLLCLFFSVLYVGGLYVWSGSNDKDRLLPFYELNVLLLFCSVTE